MKNAVRIGIFAVICAVLVVSFYYYLSRRTYSMEETDDQTKVSEMDEVLDRNLSSNYPATPRSVIKFYNQIVMLYHDTDTTDEQVESLADQAMMLFDPELVQQNPRGTYITAVKADIADYTEHERKILQTDVCDTDDVEYKTLGGNEMAYVVATYYLQEASGNSHTYQKYALRKNEDGQWKILAFELCDKDGTPITSAASGNE